MHNIDLSAQKYFQIRRGGRLMQLFFSFLISIVKTVQIARGQAHIRVNVPVPCPPILKVADRI